ncbi:MAG: ABC transporter ATP-binding protein [Gammaproteobacteria bacterium]|tara:strand:- start:245 stop:913 length:669 start_codon:yes stop_codon:yes gene_type:complete
MLILKDLSKSFLIDQSDSRINVINSINLSIETGTTVALTGPSGSGKSTLLNLISGIEDASSGSIIINDQMINHLSQNELCNFRNQNIGMIFQFFNLINDLTVIENISLPLLMRGVNKKNILKTVDNLIDSIGLRDRASFTPNLLSGGEAQRVAIARALVTKPSIILADEPTGNLDKRNTTNIINILIQLCKENRSTLIMVTHDNDLLTKFDQTYTIESGKIL